VDGGAADVQARDGAQDLDRSSRRRRHGTILGNWGGVWEMPGFDRGDVRRPK
jgi:hypothetical protein